MMNNSIVRLILYKFQATIYMFLKVTERLEKIIFCLFFMTVIQIRAFYK